MEALLDELSEYRSVPPPRSDTLYMSCAPGQFEEARENLSPLHELSEHYHRQLEASRDREMRLLGQVETLAGELARANAEIERMRQAGERHDQ